MKQEANFNQNESEPVLHESELPLLKKPSFQYIVSISIGVLTIIILSASAYYGIIRF